MAVVLEERRRVCGGVVVLGCGAMVFCLEIKDAIWSAVFPSMEVHMYM